MKTHSRRAAVAAFSLLELLVAGAIGTLIAAGAMSFIYFAGITYSGATAQSLINQRAGHALDFINSRVRLATSISNSASGNTLTLSIDDDPTTDSGTDGVAYNDKDHYERFKFIGVNGSTNTASTNMLVYIPNINSSYQQVLIPSGVRNLPNWNIFAVTNSGTAVVIHFGVLDNYARDRYQGIDIQATAIPLNHANVTNLVIGVLP
jgi:Tfp pilus assembly protein PilW